MLLGLSFKNGAFNASFQPRTPRTRGLAQYTYTRAAFSSPAPTAARPSLPKVSTPYAFSSPLRGPSCLPTASRPPTGITPSPMLSGRYSVSRGSTQTVSRAPRHLDPYREHVKKITAPIDMSMTYGSIRPTQPVLAQRSSRFSQLDTRRSPSPQTKPLKRRNDAYDSASSPDAAWSTLPTSKKSRKKTAEPGNKSTAKFRLPIASGILQSDPSMKRRTISYLPPAPTKASSQAQSTSKAKSDKLTVGWKVTRITPSQLREELHRDLEPSRAPISRTSGTNSARRDEKSPRAEHDSRWDARAARNYPSPPRCNSSPPQNPFIRSPHQDNTAQLPPSMHSLSESASSIIPCNMPPRQMVSGRNSLPSPPRSDPPSALQGDICASNDDVPDGRDRVHLPFNSELLEDRYVKMRRNISSVCLCYTLCMSILPVKPLT